MLSVGEQIGRYKILSALGAGGMGEVFLAEDTRLRRHVALKVLPDNLASDKERLLRFEREAFAASALNHPNILTIHEFDSASDIHFLAAEFVKGETLRDKLRSSSLSLNETLDIAIQIASALEIAHEAKIIHRDIKPANIMIRNDGLVKVLDFGLAKLTENKEANPDAEAETRALVKTTPGVVMGTVGYMSPEQARGKDTDQRTDIFSLGVVLYEMLTSKQPFSGETMSDRIAAILMRDPETPSAINTKIPIELDDIVLKALCKDCDNRYQSAKDLLIDLKELKEELDFFSKLERTSQSNKKAEAQTQIIKASTTTENEKHNSIAVLPFTHLSNDPDNEYFCDGLAEELLNALAKIDDLKVAARTSAFSFKNKNVDASEIGKALNVKTILEGSVRKSGNRLRITIQLINAADGYHLWSERYDREMQDIFDVQDEITLAVVDALKVKLLGEEKADLLKRYTNNTEAYELYLKGRYHFSKDTVDGLLRGIVLFEEATEIEPNYALAFAAQASCYTSLHVFGVLPPNEIAPKWKAAANRALEIDENLAEAHYALANYLFWYEWNFGEAEKNFKRAIKLNSGVEEIRRIYGLFLSSRKSYDESFKECKYAVELNPLSLVTQLHLGWAFLFAFEYDGALKQVGRIMEIDPDFHGAYWLLGAIHVARENFAEAVKTLEKCMSLGGTPIVESYLGCAYALAGKRDEALKTLNRFLKTREYHYSAPFHIARILAGLGEIEKALDWLEQAIEDRNGEMLYFDFNLRVMASKESWEKHFLTNLRYQDIRRRIGLPAMEFGQDKLVGEISESQTAILSPVKTAVPQANPANVTKNQEPSLPNKPKAKRKWWLFGLLGLILLTGALFPYRYFTPSNKQIESIAVLPFENASGNADLDYLSDGVSESVIDRLSQLGQLKVIARSSSFRYRGQNLDLKQIADALGVDAIVMGRVAPRGDSYQIRVDVTDVRENKQIWGENFTRKASDVQLLQTDISREIAENLVARLSGTQSQQLTKQGTTNPQAYELLLKGRFYFNKGGGQRGENFRKAVEYYEQAVAADPNFALAYAELSDAYSIGGGGILDRRQLWIKQEASARKALELDPNLADAHYAIAQTKRDNGEWAEAEREYKRAAELNPNLSKVYSGYSNYLHYMNRRDEAVAAIRRALELNPLSIVINVNAINTYYLARRYDEAITAAQKAFELEPNNSVGHSRLGNVYEVKGMYQEALAEYREVLRLRSGAGGKGLNFARVYAKMGERAKAEEILQKFKVSGNDIQGRDFALLYDALGMRDEAFAELEKDYAENGSIAGMAANPLYDNMRSDPRFQDLLRRMNLPR